MMIPSGSFLEKGFYQVQSANLALVLAIPSLLLAMAGLVNGFSSRKEVKGKTEEIWMTLTKESTDLILDRLEELKKENTRLRRENARCNMDMENLKHWLSAQGIKVPPPPPKGDDDDSGPMQRPFL